jgi:hypothetical protein
MLMAAAIVNGLTPALLALKQAGLEYLLFDETQAQAIRNGARETARQTALPDARPRVAQTSPAAQTTRDSRVAEALPALRRTQNPDRDTGEIPLPAAWRELLAKTPVAPVVWTYWELGLDLCGTPAPKRRDLLQTLLQGLAYPVGTHSFWPAALPAQDEKGEQSLEASASFFWEGVKRLQGRVVLIMGEQALRALALPGRMPAMRPLQQYRHQGRLLIALHSPDILIQEPHRLEALLEFLRRTLAPFATPALSA